MPKSKLREEVTGHPPLTNWSHSQVLTATVVSSPSFWFQECHFEPKLCTDPGLTVNLYTNEAQVASTYVIPGPKLYGSGSGSPAPAPAPVRIVFSMHNIRLNVHHTLDLSSRNYRCAHDRTSCSDVEPGR